MSSPREAAARLLHDVGKYVARTARNLPAEGVVEPALVAMMCRDLYDLPAGGRASALLAARAVELPADPRLAQAQALLVEADGLEGELRGGGAAALARARVIALTVEDLLRAVVRAPPSKPRS